MRKILKYIKQHPGCNSCDCVSTDIDYKLKILVEEKLIHANVGPIEVLDYNTPIEYKGLYITSKGLEYYQRNSWYNKIGLVITIPVLIDIVFNIIDIFI